MPLNAAAWHFSGSGRIESGDVVVYGCCVATGVARHWFTEIASAGRWTITISHANDECRSMTLASVRARYPGSLSTDFALVPLAAGRRGGTATIELDLDQPEELELAIFTPFAGLECCSTTRIHDIVVTRP